MRSLRIKFFTAAMFILAVYLFLFYIMIQVWFIHKHSPAAMTSVALPYVIVHIDLKGAPPKLKYLESLLPMMKEHGVNGLLIEYEDMFPYEGKLVNFSAKNCYPKNELKDFLIKVVKSGFVIIPLIQTFGHMEHALKLKEFMHLREIPMYPDSLCPSKVESRAMIKHMIEQIIDFHSAIIPLKYIHVGCDEVFHINKCEQCAAKGFSNMDIFIDYVKFISEYMKEKNPATTVLLWDDMLRAVKPIEWNTIVFLKNIEPVYWSYEPHNSISHVNLLNYHKRFTNIWIASAFKGADGRVATLPSIKQRFLNHFSWMNFILDYKFGGEKRVYNFKGIILTGWSRYSHMDPPCELLPAAIPSLILNLLLIKKFKMGIAAYSEVKTDVNFFNRYISDDFKKSLKCSKNIDLNNFDILDCDFESSQLYNTLKQYELIKADIVSGFNNDMTALSSVEYYASKKFMNMNNVVEHIDWCNNTLNELINVEMMLNYIMKRYFEAEVIDEYVNYKTYRSKKKLQMVLTILESYIPTRMWDRKMFAANLSV